MIQDRKEDEEKGSDKKDETKKSIHRFYHQDKSKFFIIQFFTTNSFHCFMNLTQSCKTLHKMKKKKSISLTFTAKNSVTDSFFMKLL